MPIGLKRGIVELTDHDPEWELIAADIIKRLQGVFSSVAKDIQHVGSTAIKTIKAKPVIDIAVLVEDFIAVETLEPAIESAGFVCRFKLDEDWQRYIALNGSNSDIRISNIHVVKRNRWNDYINFRDYLNANICIAKEYEDMKVRLAAENPIDPGREKYLAGKAGFITEKIALARLWNDFGRTFTKIKPVTKGWSDDKKYYVEAADGKKMLLRISDISGYDRKKIEFEMIKKVTTLGVPTNKPLDFGTCGANNSVYILLSWVEGEDAEKILPLMTETEQYALGLKSGKELKKIHSIPAPSDTEEWALRFNRKTDNKIKNYKECGLSFDGDTQIIEYIEKNRSLLDNRPQSFHHGDYHIGNMIISEDKELYIIDWNRSDYGDPWEEFNRIVWCAQKSPHFATGMVNGYFDGEVPMEFWQLLALYIGSNTLSSIYWAKSFGKEEIETMMKQSQEVLEWFDNMQNPVPTWYLKGFYIQWIDGIPYKLKAPFDFSFISKYGKVFKVFDDQDSGNICFGVSNDETKYFIKFAGAPTDRGCVTAEVAIDNLKRTTQIYKDLAHSNLIRLIDSEKIGFGYAMIFEWVDAVCMHPMYPLSHKQFMQTSLETRNKIYEEILDFHAYITVQGYVAIDFYDGSIMYDFGNDRTIICDIDFYSKTPYINNMGRLWGSSRFMSPEEFKLGAEIDEITNVYTMGATAFALFGDERDRCIEKWKLSKELFDVAKKAVSDKREKRQQSIKQLIAEWRAANV